MTGERLKKACAKAGKVLNQFGVRFALIAWGDEPNLEVVGGNASASEVATRLRASLLVLEHQGARVDEAVIENRRKQLH